MDGSFMDKDFSLLSSHDTLVAVDLSKKQTIRALESEVKKITGLDWKVTQVHPEHSYISWELLLPVNNGKIHISALSNKDRLKNLYGFSVEDEEMFMKALKLIERLK